MPYRTEVLAHADDGRAKTIEQMLSSTGVNATVRVVDVYSSEDDGITKNGFISAVANPVTQRVRHSHERGNPEPKGNMDSRLRGNDDWGDFTFALEISFLPGVTDNVGHTAAEILDLSQQQMSSSGLSGGSHTSKDPLDKPEGDKSTAVHSSRLYLIDGDVTREQVETLSQSLANTLIQRIQIKSVDEFRADGGMGITILTVQLSNQGSAADKVSLDLSDDDLEKLGRDGIQNPDGTTRGPLGLSLQYIKSIKAYFDDVEGRDPTDIEIEMLAQSWSEHCKHTIFASPIDEIKDGIYKHYIKRATNDIRAAKKAAYLERHSHERGNPEPQDTSSRKMDSCLRGNDSEGMCNFNGDICVSVFSDNAGGIIFDDEYLITDKVETHNSPSALDPFGGAITGIVGVNRDCMGFGKGAKPVINRYGFCLADPRPPSRHSHERGNPEPQENMDSRLRGNDGVGKSKFDLYRDKARTIPILPPENIMNGVVQGVEAGGNQSGIPTPQGFVYFDDRYVGKPLVFVGTIGLIPREINGIPGHEKAARPGDKIIMAGGRVGRDGIHGATFSSVELDENSPATAVQIGDPITQKKMSDAIIKEIRDLGLYTAITDNGAGGLSSSVGEMAEQSGGFHVELDKVPLKYPGMAPWEIWISESQERMTLAVPPENCDKIIDHLARRGVEATVIGTYTDTGRAHITYNGETIMDMTMDFLHDGIPETPLTTTFTVGGEDEPDLAEPLRHSHSPLRHSHSPLPHSHESGNPEPKGKMDSRLRGNDDKGEMAYEQTLLTMLARLNICSKEFISTQYDHNVQGSAVLGPLQGKGRVYADASITKPVLTSPKGVVLSQGLFPRYSDIDTYHMSTAALDFAVRAAVTAGADIDHLALLDNFCWCSSDEPERLGQLKRSAEAIYELATLYGTPFISGKDSMFNDFKGFDAAGNPVKISAPPTLLISSIGVIPDVMQAISLAPKAAGDLVYLLGETENELGASEYYDQHGHLGRNVPQTHGARNLMLYKLYSRAARQNLISSGMAVGFGGLGVTLAKKAIGGGLGLDIDLSSVCHSHPPLRHSHESGNPEPQEQSGRKVDSRLRGNDNSANLRPDKALYAESTGRIVVTVAPQNMKKFEKTFKKFHHIRQIGHVAYTDTLSIRGILDVQITDLEEAYKGTLKKF
jgi:phosphoribosylformylglycinamidine (FGAM) synthase-like enzyme